MDRVEEYILNLQFRKYFYYKVVYKEEFPDAGKYSNKYCGLIDINTLNINITRDQRRSKRFQMLYKAERTDISSSINELQS